jgi:hypothetical protein
MRDFAYVTKHSKFKRDRQLTRSTRNTIPHQFAFAVVYGVCGLTSYNLPISMTAEDHVEQDLF